MSDRPNEERLDELEEHIQEARKKTEAVVNPAGHEEHFYESGEESDQDDQTIAPPG
jgi:hypothetical protein